MATIRKPVAKPTPAPVATPDVETSVIAPTLPAPVAKVESVLRETTDQTLATARDAQEQFRKVVEQGVAQTRAGYEKLKIAAEEATGTIESSYQAATKGVTALNTKAIDLFKAQSEANLEHVKAMMSAKSFGEAIALQTSHARKQFETLTAQAKDFAELAQKVAAEASEPIKSKLNKSFAA